VAASRDFQRRPRQEILGQHATVGSLAGATSDLVAAQRADEVID